MNQYQRKEPDKFSLHNQILEGTIIGDGVTIGQDNIIGPHAVIGTPPQHWDYYRTGKSAGVIKIGDGNVIREFTTIHSSFDKETIVGNKCFIMESAHIGHDTILEDNITLSCSVKIGGHSYIMEGANLGLSALVHQHSTVGAYAMVGMGAIVTKDIIPFVVYRNFECSKVNVVGMERAGFEKEEILEVDKWFREYKPLMQLDSIRENYFESERLNNIIKRFLNKRNESRRIQYV